jgi:hypothetical protein
MYMAKDWQWINEQLPILYVEDSGGIVVYDHETETQLAACVMDNWTDNSVQCHLLVADKRALRHRFLDLCFEFIFVEMGRNIIYGLVPGDNDKALRLNAHMGFTEKCRFENAFKDGVDYVIMELKKEHCKYLPKEEAA